VCREHPINMFAPKAVAGLAEIGAEERRRVRVPGYKFVMHLRRCSDKMTYLGSSRLRSLTCPEVGYEVLQHDHRPSFDRSQICRQLDPETRNPIGSGLLADAHLM
jgi:hypothetical protein